MMSAEDLHDAVVSLGLTRYTEQDLRALEALTCP